MSTLATNAITDAAGGNTATINSYTPTESNMAGRNRIINGDMRISQRNAGGSVSIDGGASYTLDRYLCQDNTDGSFSVQQSTTAPAGFVNSLLVTITGTDSSLTTTQFGRVVQRIEGTNISDLAWGSASAKTVTLSFWVRSSVTGTFGGSLTNSDANRIYAFSYTISSANTFEYKTINIAGDTTGTWLTTTGTGIEVNFGLGAGPDRSVAAGSWGTSLAYNATGATNLFATSGATFYITGVQLEEGSVATPFERRHYGQELALCQRYCQVYGSGNGYERLGMAMGVSSLSINLNIYLPVTMRATPSVSSTGSWAWYNGSSVVAGTTFTLDALSTQVVALILATTGATSGSTYQVINYNDPSARLTLNSEL